MFFDFAFLRLGGIFSQAVTNAGEAITSFVFAFIDFFAGVFTLPSFGSSFFFLLEVSSFVAVIAFVITGKLFLADLGKAFLAGLGKFFLTGLGKLFFVQFRISPPYSIS